MDNDANTTETSISYRTYYHPSWQIADQHAIRDLKHRRQQYQRKQNLKGTSAPETNGR